MEQKKERMRFLYNETATHYDDRYLPIQSQKYQYVLKKIELQEVRTLDVGGGSGLFARLTGRITDVVDISVGLLAQGVPHCSECNWIAGDGENLPIRKGAYGVVVSFSALQNYPDRKKGLLEMLRVLDKSGILVVTALGKSMDWKELETLAKGVGMNFDRLDLPIEDVGIVGGKERKA